MQDSPNNSFDPELINRGWADLEKRLDESLPHKPKRRFFWLWFPLLLGVFVLGGTSWMAINQNNTAPALLPAVNQGSSKRPVAQTSTNTEPLASVSPSETTVNAVVGEDNEIPISNPTQVLNKQSTNKVTEESPTSLVTNKQTVSAEITPSVEMGDEAALDNNNNTTIENRPIASNNTVLVEDVNLGLSPGKTETALLQVSAVSSVDLLANQAIPLLTEKEISFTEFPTVNAPRVNSKWNFYTEGQLTVAIGKQAGLLGIGAGVERKLSNAWHLGLGFTYERSQESLSTSNLGGDDLLDGEQFTPIGSYNVAYNLSSVYHSISYDRLKSELQLSYQLAPRWRLSTGIALAYYKAAILNGNENGETLGVGGPVEDNRFLASVDLYQEDIAVYEYDPITNAAQEPYQLSPNRLQLAQTISVQYQFTPHWAANIGYRHDLTNWDKSNDVIGSSSFAQFGLRYYIGK